MASSLVKFLVGAGILAAKHARGQAVECPAGWYETAGRCFRVLDFGDTEKQSWEAAMGLCAAHGTPLATIHTPEEHSLIASLSARYKDECWTGLRKYKRYKPDKGWLWIDRDQSLDDYDYLNWGNEWQSVWKILPPDEKCGTIKQDGWGNRPCWGPGSKLQCFVCGTLDPNASVQAKKAFQDDFQTGNWWIPPPPTAHNGNNIGNSQDGWNIEALGAGDSVAIEDPNTFWDDGQDNQESIDPSLLRTTTTVAPPPTTTTMTPPPTTTSTAKRITTTTTKITTTTTPPPTTTTTTKPTTTTTTTPPPTTTKRTTTTSTTTPKPPTTTTTTRKPNTTTPAPTTTTTTQRHTTTYTHTETHATLKTVADESKDFADANQATSPENTTAQESSIITGLAVAIGAVAALAVAGAGGVAYKRVRDRRLAQSSGSTPEAQSFTDMES